MSENDQALEIRRLLDSQAKRVDPFAILKIDIETCEVSDVNKAYRSIALQLHPDKCKLPYAAEAFRIAEKAHKLLSQEVALNHLKRAHMRRKELHSETTSSSLPNVATEQKPNLVPSSVASKIQFGKLSKLASLEISTDDQKAAEIDRLLRCKPTDYFIILDLDPEKCEVSDVDRRYRRMAQALHPDKCQLPRVSDAFNLFEKAHKELNDDRKLRRFKMSFLQQQKREAALHEDMERAGHRREQQRQADPSSGLTAEERLELRKREALREQQMEAIRLADEAARKKKRTEEKEIEMRELAVELERQRKEWRDLQIF